MEEIMSETNNATDEKPVVNDLNKNVDIPTKTQKEEIMSTENVEQTTPVIQGDTFTENPPPVDEPKLTNIGMDNTDSTEPVEHGVTHDPTNGFDMSMFKTKIDEFETQRRNELNDNLESQLETEKQELVKTLVQKFSNPAIIFEEAVKAVTSGYNNNGAKGTRKKSDLYTRKKMPDTHQSILQAIYDGYQDSGLDNKTVLEKVSADFVQDHGNTIKPLTYTAKRLSENLKLRDE